MKTRITISRWMLAAPVLSVLCLAVVFGAPPAGFDHRPPGELTPGSGQGRLDTKVYLPGMRFPLEKDPSFLNSQVWGTGGSNGPAGSQCAAVNYSYPWRDNFCETRTHGMPLCPAGKGHQGQDLRPATCKKDVHKAVAAIDGVITSVGSFSVYLTADDGSATRVDYLHMSNVAVKVGDKVKQGQVLGMVSNVFPESSTTIHLHLNIRQKDSLLGFVFVPPYLSLVEAYKRM